MFGSMGSLGSGGGAGLTISTTSIAAGTTGSIATLSSGLPGALTFSRLSGTNLTVSGSTGAVNLSIALAAGASVVLRARVQNTSGDAIEREFTFTAAAVAAAPSYGAGQAPTISGTAQVGQSLTATPGTPPGWPTPTLAGQWQRNGAAIAGATGLVYVQVTADIGASMTYGEVATNASGSASATSNALGPVAAANATPAWFVSAEIEGPSGPLDGNGNGWVLALRHTAPVLNTTQRSFGSETGDHPLFPFTSDATPKITVTQTGLAGFDRSGGQAVAATVDGPSAVATKPLRTVYGAVAPGSTETVSYLDQTDHGDGTVTIRIALSQRILAGATVSATFAAGWRSGFSGGTIAVTNNSGRAAIPPIVRYATPNLRLVRGSAAAPNHIASPESIVASHYAKHYGPVLHQAVAAVRYAVTDGTTVRFFWFTAPTASGQYGDSALVWGGNMDLSSGSPATPEFNPGVLTIHRSVFPWVGAARHTSGTDPASMTAAALHATDINQSFAATSDRPSHLCYDPRGTRYTQAVVVVAPSGGSTDTTTAGITVGTGADRATALAAARAGTKAASLTAAIQRISVANRQLAAANGFPLNSNCIDWAEIVFEAGTHAGPGSTTVGTNAKTPEGRVLLTGDAGAILQPGASAPNLRASRFWASGLVLEHTGTATYASSTGSTWHLDNCVFRAAAGQEATTSGLVTAPAGGLIAAWLSATQTTWWRHGLGMAGSNHRFSLIRGCTTAREAQALVLVHVQQVIDPTITYPGGSGSGPDSFGGWPADVADQMAWGCIALRNNGRFYNPGRSSGANTGANPDTYTRMALINCVGVRANNATEYKLIQGGESQNNQTQDSLMEGCTFVGQRMNWHNDPPVATDNLRHTGNAFRGNYFDRLSSKADTFPTASANRTGSWEFHYGVGFRDNVLGERGGLGSDQFTLQSYGPNTIRNQPAPGPGTIANALFQDDQSNWSPNATTPGIGGVGTASGDYRVKVGSPLLTRAIGAMSPATLIGGGARGTIAGAMGQVP